MSQPETEWQKLQAEAKTLRNEVRLKLHLASKETRDVFHALDKAADHLAGRLEVETRLAWEDVVKGLKKLRDELVDATAP